MIDANYQVGERLHAPSQAPGVSGVQRGSAQAGECRQLSEPAPNRFALLLPCL